MGIGMRDLQSPTGVWFPTGMDAVGVESWAIKVSAKVVKDEVRWQLGEWKAKYEMLKEFDSDTLRSYARMTRAYYRTPKDNELKAERSGEAKSQVDLWKKWNTYLANMPDDEALSLTKKDYEMFFADRDQREGKA